MGMVERNGCRTVCYSSSVISHSHNHHHDQVIDHQDWWYTIILLTLDPASCTIHRTLTLVFIECLCSYVQPFLFTDANPMASSGLMV